MLVFWFLQEGKKFTDYTTNTNPEVGDVFVARCKKDGHEEKLKCFELREGYVWASELVPLKNGAYPVHFVEVGRSEGNADRVEKDG